ncbi:MAG: SpoIIE family protein phosphatase [Ruminococcus sp.]|nr:SpoIIE family protein phosphatase [Ruminococcus sp.]
MFKQFNFTGTLARHRTALCISAVSLTAFAASAGSAAGRPSYLNAGLAVIFPECALPVFLSSALFYLAAGALSKGIVPLSSILLLSFFRWFLKHISHRSPLTLEPLMLAAVSALIPGTLSVVCSSALALPFYDTAAGIAASAILGCFVFSFCSLSARYARTGAFQASGAELLHLAVIYISVISALSGAVIGFLDLGRLLSCAFLLLAAKKRGPVGGACFGALATCAMLVGAPELAASTLLLSAAGLICGSFSQLGTLAVSLSFIITCAAGLVSTGAGSDTFFMFADAAAGAMLFVLVPERYARRFTALVFGSRSVYSALSSITASRLEFVSGTLADIRRQIVLVNSALENKSTPPSPADSAWDGLCSSCPKNGCCGGEMKHRERLLSLAETVLHFGEITSVEAAKAFPDCTKPELLADSFNYSAAYLAEYRAERLRSSQLRALLCEQLVSMEEVLGDLSCRVGAVRGVDPVLSSRISDRFASLGYHSPKACVYLDRNGFRRAEVYVRGSFNTDLAAAAIMVSDIADIDFELPAVKKTGGVTMLVFHERSAYSVESGVFTAAGSASPVSGDVVSLLELPSGSSCAILADGMGTGPRARLDAAFAADLAGRLLGSGVSVKAALRLVNSALLTKNADESFAAVDILTIDPFTGSAELFKAGAAPTYLLRDGVFREFGDRSFPVGILNGTDCTSYSCKLFDGDCIIMTSDGVGFTAVQKLSELVSGSVLPAKEAARAVGMAALNEYKTSKRKNGASNPPRDDISAAVFRISLRKDGI